MAGARQYYSTVAATRVTTTATTAQVAATLTFTPDASSTYYILAFAVGDSSAVGSFYAIVELYDSTAAAVKDNCYCSPWTAGDKNTFVGLCSLTSSASPGPQTYQVRFRCSTTSMTAGISDILLIAVKGTTADTYAEKRTSGSTSSATFASQATASFTPATAGTYVVIAKADLTNGGSNGIEARLFDGTTAYNSITGGSDAAGPQPMTWAAVVGTSSLSAAQTWSVQTAGISGNGGGSYNNCAVLALRCDAFPAYALGSRVTTASTTTSTSFADFAFDLFTPNAQAWLMLGAAMGGVAAGSKFRFADNGAALVADIPRTHTGTVASKSHTMGWGVLATPTATTHDYSIQKASNTAVSTELDEGQFVGLQLDVAVVAPSGRGPAPFLTRSLAANFIAAYGGV